MSLSRSLPGLRLPAQSLSSALQGTGEEARLGGCVCVRGWGGGLHVVARHGAKQGVSGWVVAVAVGRSTAGGAQRQCMTAPCCCCRWWWARGITTEKLRDEHEENAPSASAPRSSRPAPCRGLLPPSSSSGTAPDASAGPYEHGQQGGRAAGHERKVGKPQGQGDAGPLQQPPSPPPPAPLPLPLPLPEVLAGCCQHRRVHIVRSQHVRQAAGGRGSAAAATPAAAAAATAAAPGQACGQACAAAASPGAAIAIPFTVDITIRILVAASRAVMGRRAPRGSRRLGRSGSCCRR